MRPRFNIMKTIPDVPDEEIEALMDFNRLLEASELALNQRRTMRRRWKSVVIAAVVLSSVLMIWYFYGHLQESRRDEPEAHALPPSPMPRDTVDRSVAELRNRASEVVERPAPLKAPANARQGHRETSVAGKQNKASTMPRYVQAEPIDGYPALYDYFDKNLVYPEEALAKSVDGVAEVTFVIDTTGRAVEIRIENSLGEEFDREVFRLLENMPLWTPASYNGTPVRSRLSLPITFHAGNK